MRAKVVKLEKYEGARGKLYDYEQEAINSIVKHQLSETLMYDQVHYDVNPDEQAVNLVVNREEVIQLLKEWKD